MKMYVQIFYRVDTINFCMQLGEKFFCSGTISIVIFLGRVCLIAITPNPYNISLINSHTSDVYSCVIGYSSCLASFNKVFVICPGKHPTVIFLLQVVHFPAHNIYTYIQSAQYIYQRISCGSHLHE